VDVKITGDQITAFIAMRTTEQLEKVADLAMARLSE
jgi:hypothetical protein